MNKVSNRKNALFTLAAIGIVAACQGANAQTIGVSATIGANCIVATTPIAFGVYNPVAVPPLDATGQVQLTCTTGAIPTIGIDNGLNALVSQRRLASGGNFLNYNVFQPASNAAGAACAFTTAFPAPLPTPFLLTAAPSVATRAYNVCGRIPAGQSSAVGTYADTINVTVTF